MKTAIRSLHHLCNRGDVGDVTDDQCRRRGNVPPMAGRQIVEHPHGVAPRHQGVAQMGADEPRAAGHDVDAHALEACAPPSGVWLKHLAQDGPVGQAVEAFVDLVKGDGS